VRFSRSDIFTNCVGLSDSYVVTQDSLALIHTYRSIYRIIKKGKVVPLHALEALGGRGDISPTHSRPRH
jgi:hypothetical protein